MANATVEVKGTTTHKQVMPGVYIVEPAPMTKEQQEHAYKRSQAKMEKLMEIWEDMERRGAFP